MTTERMTTERTDDPLISQSEEAEAEARRTARAANLFDVRRLIGALFAVYGVILTILGIGASEAEKQKAAGINLNLWVGISMLIVAALFLLWAFARPLANELGEGGDDGEQAQDGENGDGRFSRPEGDRTVRGAPAPSGPDAAALAGSQTTSRRARRDGDGSAGSRAAGRQER